MKIDRLIFNDCMITQIDAEISITGDGIIVKDFEFDDIFAGHNLSAAEIFAFLAGKNYSQTEANRRISRQIEKYCNQFADKYKAIFEEDPAIKYPAMLTFHTLQRTHFFNIYLNFDF